MQESATLQRLSAGLSPANQPDMPLYRYVKATRCRARSKHRPRNFQTGTRHQIDPDRADVFLAHPAVPMHNRTKSESGKLAIRPTPANRYPKPRRHGNSAMEVDLSAKRGLRPKLSFMPARLSLVATGGHRTMTPAPTGYVFSSHGCWGVGGYAMGVFGPRSTAASNKTLAPCLEGAALLRNGVG